MVAPLLLGILGAGLASQGLVHGYAIPKHNQRQGRRAQGILDELPDGANIDQQREALMGGGLLSPERYAEIGFDDAASERDFFEQMRVNAANNQAAMARTNATNQAAMDRTTATNQAAMDRLTYTDDLAERQRREQRARELSGNSFGIGMEASYSGATNPYATRSALDYASDAISSIETGSFSQPYQARGPVVESGQYKGQRALGKYQVMPGNLPEWSKRALGFEVSPEEYLANPEYQDAVFKEVFGKNMEQYGFADAASIWFSGQPLEAAAARSASDGYTDVTDYVTRATSAFQNSAQTNAAMAARFTPELREEVQQVAGAIDVSREIFGMVQDKGAWRSLDRGQQAYYRTQAELTVIPLMQRLVNSGALQQGELEQFKDWIGDPVGTSLTNQELGRYQGALEMIAADTMRSLQAAGVDPRYVVPQGFGAPNMLPGVPADEIPADASTVGGGN